MTMDFAAIVEVAKDKVGRKQIIALATLICLTYLISQDIKDIYPLGMVLVAGVVGMVIQAILDWKCPRVKPPG